MHTLIRLTIACVITTAIYGCGGEDGPKRVAVDGTVKVDGQPLEDGVVTLTPNSSTPGSLVSLFVKGGEFKVDRASGPSPGSYTASLNLSGEDEVADEGPRKGPLADAPVEDSSALNVPKILKTEVTVPDSETATLSITF